MEAKGKTRQTLLVSSGLWGWAEPHDDRANRPPLRSRGVVGWGKCPRFLRACQASGLLRSVPPREVGQDHLPQREGHGKGSCNAEPP